LRIKESVHNLSTKESYMITTLGMSKHRKSGTPPTNTHFTGKRKGPGGTKKRVVRPQKQKHKNKYEHKRGL